MRIRAQTEANGGNGSPAFPSSLAGIIAPDAREAGRPAGGTLSSELITASDMEHPAARKIRALRAMIIQATVPKPRGEANTCALIGIDCGDELPGIAGNLAIVTTRLGMPTLLIEADFRQPRLAQLFDVPRETGLVNYLDGSGQHPAPRPTAIDGLYLLPAGPEQELSTHFLERYSILEATRGWPAQTQCVIAGLPIARGQECGFLANVFAGFDCAVLLTKQHRTSYDRVRSVIDVLDAATIPIAGTVLL
jgi:hypothetical protein